MNPSPDSCSQRFAPRARAIAALLSLAMVAGTQSSCHQIHEARANKLAKSALEHFDRAEYELALDHSEIALRLGAAVPELHQVRAAIFLQQGEAEKAVAETDAGLALAANLIANPKPGHRPISDELQAQLHFARGNALQAAGRLAECRDAFDASLHLVPDFAGSRNNLAWLLATAPDDAVRDGKRAVEHAERACELTEWEDAGTLDTLAAAYAEAGDFPSAVRWQREAIDHIGAGEVFENTEGFRERLELYEEGKPYREDPVALFEASTAERAEAP